MTALMMMMMMGKSKLIEYSNKINITVTKNSPPCNAREVFYDIMKVQAQKRRVQG